jgi:hypothetical protein
MAARLGQVLYWFGAIITAGFLVLVFLSYRGNGPVKEPAILILAIIAGLVPIGFGRAAKFVLSGR